MLILFFIAASKTCPGVCVAERIADYCEAYITTENLCKPGLRCCVSSDAYGDKLPNNIVIPNKSKNTSRVTTIKPQITTDYYKPTKPITKTTPPPIQECPGECVSGLFALFCDDINTDVECPGEATCCITNAVSYIRTRLEYPTKIESSNFCTSLPYSSFRRCHFLRRAARCIRDRYALMHTCLLCIRKMYIKKTKF